LQRILEDQRQPGAHEAESSDGGIWLHPFLAREGAIVHGTAEEQGAGDHQRSGEEGIVGQGHGHQGEGVQEVDAIGHIGEGLRVQLLPDTIQIPQDILAVGPHKDGRCSANAGQPHEMIMASGEAVQ